jgi:hypothetical protein
MQRKSIIRNGLILSGFHLTASMLIVPLTLRVSEYFMGGNWTSPILTGLHLLTRALYFPVLGLGLYPRHWFPGPWISIPILINSLLWGMLAAGVLRLSASFNTKR